jgi:hypothetical protein
MARGLICCLTACLPENPNELLMSLMIMGSEAVIDRRDFEILTAEVDERTAAL